MSDPSIDAGREALRQWVETWRRAGAELDRIHRCELESVDTQEAIRQIFGAQPSPGDFPPRPTSGLVEQQAWFARLRSGKPLP
jgi:hypothetical protein